MKVYELKVPFGIGPNGIEAHPETAQAETPYLCPDCRGALVPRRGTRKRPHFAHKAVPD